MASPVRDPENATNAVPDNVVKSPMSAIQLASPGMDPLGQGAVSPQPVHQTVPQFQQSSTGQAFHPVYQPTPILATPYTPIIYPMSTPVANTSQLPLSTDYIPAHVPLNTNYSANPGFFPMKQTVSFTPANTPLPDLGHNISLVKPWDVSVPVVTTITNTVAGVSIVNTVSVGAVPNVLNASSVPIVTAVQNSAGGDAVPPVTPGLTAGVTVPVMTHNQDVVPVSTPPTTVQTTVSANSSLVLTDTVHNSICSSALPVLTTSPIPGRTVTLVTTFPNMVSQSAVPVVTVAQNAVYSEQHAKDVQNMQHRVAQLDPNKQKKVQDGHAWPAMHRNALVERTGNEPHSMVMSGLGLVSQNMAMNDMRNATDAAQLDSDGCRRSSRERKPSCKMIDSLLLADIDKLLAANTDLSGIVKHANFVHPPPNLIGPAPPSAIQVHAPFVSGQTEVYIDRAVDEIAGMKIEAPVDKYNKPSQQASNNGEVSKVSAEDFTYDDSDNKFHCQRCAYCSPRIEKIQQHMEAHIKARWGCELCGRAFIKSCDMDRHAIAHAKNRVRPAKSSEKHMVLPMVLHSSNFPTFLPTAKRKPKPKPTIPTDKSVTSPTNQTSTVETVYTVSTFTKKTTSYDGKKSTPNETTTVEQHREVHIKTRTGKLDGDTISQRPNRSPGEVKPLVIAPRPDLMALGSSASLQTIGSTGMDADTEHAKTLGDLAEAFSSPQGKTSSQRYGYLNMLLGDEYLTGTDIAPAASSRNNDNSARKSQGSVFAHSGDPARNTSDIRSKSSSLLETNLGNKVGGPPQRVPTGDVRGVSPGRSHTYAAGSTTPWSASGNSLAANSVVPYSAAMPYSGSGGFIGGSGNFAINRHLGPAGYSGEQDIKPQVITVAPIEPDVNAGLAFPYDNRGAMTEDDQWHDNVNIKNKISTNTLTSPSQNSESPMIKYQRYFDQQRTDNVLPHINNVIEITPNFGPNERRTLQATASQPLVDTSAAHYTAGRAPLSNAGPVPMGPVVPNSSVLPVAQAPAPVPMGPVIQNSSSNTIRNMCCTICSYSTKDPWQLEKHLLAHTKGSKICRFCNKAFERPSDLARHEERHIVPSGSKDAEPPISSSSMMLTQTPAPTANTFKKPSPPPPAKKSTGAAGDSGNVAAKQGLKFHPFQGIPQPIKLFQCDGCVSQFISEENLQEHKEIQHSMFCARLDEFKDNELYNTSILKCELGGNNEITVCIATLTVAELAAKPIPSISSPADVRSILERPQDTFHTDKAAMMRKGGNIWVKHFMRSVTSSESTVVEKPVDANANPSTAMLSESSGNNQIDTSTTTSDVSSPPTMDPLSDAMHVRPVEAIFRCIKCNYTTNVRANWDEHQRAHDGRYICKICGKAFLKTSDLTRHWVGHVTVPGNPGIIQCDSCPFQSTDKAQLEAHMKAHYAISSRQPSPPKKRARLQSPERTGGNDVPMNTNEVPPVEKPLTLQMTREPIAGPSAAPSLNTSLVYCGHCTQSFMRRLDLDLHVQLVHRMGNQSPISSSIGRSKNTNIGRHVISDSEEEEEEETGYECKYCGDEFVNQNQLDKHERIHKATISSSKTTTPKPQKLKPRSNGYVCRQCSLVFESRKALARHMDTHIIAKDAPMRQLMECEVCGKVLMACYLAEHLRTHTGEKPLACRCGRNFTWKSAYTSHTKKCDLANSLN